MKYLILMVLSFGAMAEEDHAARMANALIESNLIIEQLVNRIEELEAQSFKDVEQATQFRKILVKITHNCMSGLDFVSIDDGNRAYQFHCQEAF